MRCWLRFGLAAGALVLASGCNGFPKTVPIEEAESRPEHYLTYALAPVAVPVGVGNQRFLPSPAPLYDTPAASMLQTADATGMAALRWDVAPYEALYSTQTPMRRYLELR